MLIRRTVLAAALLLGWGALLPAAAAPVDDMPAEAAKFVDGVVHQALTTLKDGSLSREERMKRMLDLYLEGFDTRSIGIFVLGVYAGRVRGDLRDEYIKEFRQYVIRQYFARLELLGDQFTITKTAPDGEDIAWVTSALGSAGDKPYRVEWRVHKTDNGLRIFDVILEGTSLLWIQRNAFVNFLQQNGGDVEKLIAVMRVRKIGLDTPND